MQTQIHLHLEGRQLTLLRHPLRPQEKLQAWDGADRYILHHRMKHCLPPLLIVNDDFGALSLATGKASYHWNDSWLARHNWQQNAKLNKLAIDEEHWHWPLDNLPPTGEVWLKVPKELALLTYQLHRLTSELAPNTPIYLAWLDKHVPSTLIALVREYLADVDLLPGRFKAHGLVGYARGEAPRPLPYPSLIEVPQLPQPLVSHAGVFAQHQLDIGSRFMLEHLPTNIDGHIVDLACGNGVLGLVVASKNPQSRLTFADESAMAVASATENWQRLFPQREAEFIHGNGLEDWQGKATLVLLNPPFHQAHTLDTALAFALFKQAAERLQPKGELWVVANQHLPYKPQLQRLFQRVVQHARHPKFVLWRAWASKLQTS